MRFISFVVGICTTLLVGGIYYLYTRTVRRITGNTESIRELERAGQEDNRRLKGDSKSLEENNRTASALIQKAKGILDSGKHTNSN